MKLLEMTFARVRFRYSYILIATLIVFTFGVPLARAQGDCKLVLDASEKLTVTPHHGYSTCSPVASKLPAKTYPLVALFTFRSAAVGERAR